MAKALPSVISLWSQISDMPRSGELIFVSMVPAPRNQCLCRDTGRAQVQLCWSGSKQSSTLVSVHPAPVPTGLAGGQQMLSLCGRAKQKGQRTKCRGRGVLGSCPESAVLGPEVLC